MDTTGKVHISYYDKTNGDLKYATNTTGSWVKTTVDSSGDVGRYTSLAVDKQGSTSAIIMLRMATSKYLMSANATGSWVKTTVDSSGVEGGIPP
ncbi:MAG: hypothetical protein U0586_09950 [Candidatus Brocadiaceae bacterium]